MTKPSLIVFSPLPPLENGIADYCYELLVELGEFYSLILVIDNHVPAPQGLRDNWKVLRLYEYLFRQKELIDFVHLYQVGNNPDHAYLLPTLFSVPGIVVLHDISLHYLIDQISVGQGDFSKYTNLLESEFGAPGRILGEQFDKRRWRSRAVFYELPMIRLLTARAKAVIVHSNYGLTKVLAQENDTPVRMIRHHLAPKAIAASAAISRVTAREMLGVNEDEILLVSLGFISPAKQISHVLNFLAENREALPQIRYILAGQDQPEHYDVKGEIDRLGLSDIVTITGYLREDDFFVYTIAADLVVNLRYPTGGETSGTLIRALGIGACSVIVDIGPFSEYPDDICVKIPWSDQFYDQLKKVLFDLILNDKKRALYVEHSREYMRSRHSIESSVQQYRDTIREYGSRDVLHWQGSHSFDFLTQIEREWMFSDLSAQEIKEIPLWFREGLFPINSATVDRSVVVIASSRASTKLIQKYLGYSDSVEPTFFDEKTWPKAANTEVRRRFSLGLIEFSDLLGENYWFPRLQALNKVLEVGAIAVISGEYFPSDKDAKSLRTEIESAISDNGFRVQRFLSTPESMSFVLDRFDNPRLERDWYYAPCWQIIKVSEFSFPTRSSWQVDSIGTSAP